MLKWEAPTTCITTVLYMAVVDVVVEVIKVGEIVEVRHADDSILMRETIEGIRNKLNKWNIMRGWA